MRALCWLWLIVLLGCGAAPVDASKAAEARRPRDVIVITVDTLRADRVGAWGYESARAPRIDALVASGARFDAAITPEPRTTPGLGSFWTGLYPHHHAAREVGIPVALGTSWAEVLQARGYVTRGVSANEAASASTGLADGFDRFTLRAGEDAAAITDAALEGLSDVPADEPLLLWVHYLDPHAPYAAPGADAQPACVRAQAQPIQRLAIDLDGVASAGLDACRRAYDAELAFADTEISRLLTRLEATGRLEDAYVIFASDHGEGFGERGLFYEHGPNVHHSNLHVPLSIAGPGIASGRVVRAPVSLIDVAPSVYALLDVPEDERPEVDGVSRAGAIRGGTSEPGPVFAESAGALVPTFDEALIAGHVGAGYCLHGPRFTLCWQGADDEPRLYERALDPLLVDDVRASHPEAYALMASARARWMPSGAREHMVWDGRFKLVERPRLEGGYARTLHDLESDLEEQHDVSDAHPEVVARLGGALDAWSEDLPHYRPVALSPEQEAALRALGYIE